MFHKIKLWFRVLKVLLLWRKVVKLQLKGGVKLTPENWQQLNAQVGYCFLSLTGVKDGYNLESANISFISIEDVNRNPYRK